MSILAEKWGTECGVSLHDATLRYGTGLTAIESLSLTIQPGDFVSIVGPSGCGKSTLLRLVAGLLRPTSGQVEVGGMEAREARRKRRNVSFVFQQPTLLPWRSVEKNVRLPLELSRRTRPEDRQLADDAIRLVGLEDFRRFYPAMLSGGMQMRVSIARSLATRPGLLLLDEPFAALDDITRQRLNEELLALWAADGFTAIFVTHNVQEAVFLSQRIFVMSARPGRIIEEVTVPFVLPRPADLRAEPKFARLAGEVSALLRKSYQ